MKTSPTFLETLFLYLATNELIEVDRSPLDPHLLRGFVVGVSSQFLCLRVVDDAFLLNGYAVVSVADVQRVRLLSQKGDMIRYILSQRYRSSDVIESRFDLGEMLDFSFLENVHQFYPLLTVHREAIDRGVCYIGQVEALKPKTFTLRTIDPDGTWGGRRRFRYEDVTLIEFGGNYEQGLWMYAEYQESVGQG